MDKLGFKVDLESYLDLFVQACPRYTVKMHEGVWRTKNKPMAKKVVQAHLNGLYSVGSLGRWYPPAVIFDFDNVSLGFVGDVRTELKLNEKNSMLVRSESKDSYHLIVLGTYNGKPPTVKLLHEILDGYTKEKGFELFPQVNRTIRLPFEPGHICLDNGYEKFSDFWGIDDDQWKKQLFYLINLDEVDLGSLPGFSYQIDLPYNADKSVKLESLTTYEKGRQLLENGLLEHNSRNESQFCIAYHLWRKNYAPEVATKILFEWIANNNNGFSKDWEKYPHNVRNEIKRQIATIWCKYQYRGVYPDKTHNRHHGYIAKPDLFKIVDITKGSLPKSRFLFHIVRHSYPRRFKHFIPVHRDKLIEWGSKKTYKSYLDEFEEKGIIKRGSAYSVGQFSKNLRLNWKYKTDKDAILFEGKRSLDTFDESLRLIHKPQDYADKLRSVNMSKQNIRYQVATIFDSTG